MPRRFWLALTIILWTGPAWPAAIDAQAINDAEWRDKKSQQQTLSPFIVKLQVLLDRAHFSPGEIDGKPGENVDKAIAAYAAAQGATAGGGMSAELWQKLIATFKNPIIVEHKISEADVKGPFAEKLPSKMEDMKDLPALSYTGPKEKIAEQFHMSQELLAALNPGQSFDKPGDTIMVANVSREPLPAKAARIEIDKTHQTLKIFDKSNTLVAVYPVTAGSTEKPAPTGILKVTSVAKNPTYRYNPEYAFKGVKSQEAFTIRPGPNNPVGLVWVGLNREGYGIHGTPEPSKISKSESHGCIRLTNWDALQLASAVAKGVVVEFTGDETARRAARADARPAKSRHRRR
jgi:lipoprotein-anchoring transpeptidase ErfK/SrfK